MNLESTLHNISILKFYKGCQLSNKSLYHKDFLYNDLPPKVQIGILNLITDLFEIQKTIFSYDIDYIDYQLKKSFVKRKPFYKDAGLPVSFWRTLSLLKDKEDRLIKIRKELIKMINKLIEYVLG